MKTITRPPFKPVVLKFAPATLAVVGAFTLCALPVTAQELAPATNSVTAQAGGTVSPTNQSTTALSPGVNEILRLADAGVSADVLVAYIDSAPALPQLTSHDIIALKKKNVPDEVVKMILTRGAAARQAATALRNEALINYVESRRAIAGGVDPESYDYFRMYYLQPRADAAANQRLYPYYGPYGRAYTYGPYGVPWSGRSAYRGFR
jgi:hypothetical protein